MIAGARLMSPDFSSFQFLQLLNADWTKTRTVHSNDRTLFSSLQQFNSLTLLHSMRNKTASISSNTESAPSSPKSPHPSLPRIPCRCYLLPESVPIKITWNTEEDPPETQTWQPSCWKPIGWTWSSLLKSVFPCRVTEHWKRFICDLAERKL